MLKDSGRIVIGNECGENAGEGHVQITGEANTVVADAEQAAQK